LQEKLAYTYSDLAPFSLSVRWALLITQKSGFERMVSSAHPTTIAIMELVQDVSIQMFVD